MRQSYPVSIIILLIAIFALNACDGASGRNSTMGRQASMVAREGRAGGEKYYSLGPKFQGQLDELVGQEYMALVGRKEEVPLEFNQDVLVNLNYFLNDARGFMVRSLNRGRKYIPMMKAILRQKGLPEDLVYLALIESGFRTEAVSSASAVGPWQFIAATGRRYGLVIDEWVDERMDPVKSTYAAADYLTALHDMFNSWPLAIAAYNSGEAKIMRGMQKPEVDNYWDMAKEDGFLANETKRYVPSFLAVAIIAKDPQAYGLEIDNTPQDGWEDVIVPDAIDLQLAAELSNTTIERLKELNPQLKKLTTPPGEINFVLRVPQGARADFYKLYAQLPESQRNQSLITHTVSRSETVELVASKYNLSPEVVRQYNNIEGSKLTRGQQLVLPTSQPAAILTASATPSGSNLESGLAAASASVTTRPQQPWPDVQRTSSSRQSTQSINTISHRVRAGDTILGIAKLYAVKAEQIKTDNKLASNDIKEGQVLTIRSNLPLASSTSTRSRDSWVEVSEGAPIYHTVKKGETIGSIAASYRLSQDQLRSLNNLKSNTIRIGAKLRVGTGPAPPAQASEAGYVVRKGDTVSTIAERFGIKSDDLRRLNNLASDKIKVGETLKIAQTPSASAASSKATAIYEVKSGDAVSTIAERFKMSSNDLRTLNNLKNNNLSIGQKLKVFDPKAQPDTAAKPDPNVQIATDSAPSRNESSASDDGFYQVVSGDTVSTIAERFRMKSDELRRINSLSSDALRVGQKLKVLVGAPGAVDVSQSQPPSQSTQSTPSVQTASAYQVVSGDTVSTIAERFGMRSADLRALNNLADDNIRVGQKLQVYGIPSENGNAPSENVAAGQVAPASSAPQVVESPKPQASASDSVYVVVSGDTVSTIAERFGMRSADLRALNNLTNDNIRAGQKLQVSQATSERPSGATTQPRATTQPAPAAQSTSASASDSVYVVVSGDTVSTIAERFGMRSADLRALNNLTNDNIRAGQKLQVSQATSERPSGATTRPGATAQPASATQSTSASDSVYVVVAGDSISTIAERFGMKSQELRDLNNLTGNNIRIGQKLKVSAAGRSAGSQNSQGSQSSQGAASYTVSSGDSLFSIARKHNLTVDQLKALNGKTNDSLRAGEVLKVK